MSSKVATPKLSRRAVVLSSCGVAALAALGVLAKMLPGSTEQAVIAIVHKHLDTLELDAAGVRAFAKDYVQHSLAEAEGNRSWQVMRLFGPAYRYVKLPDVAGPIGRVRELEAQVVESFLLSSSLFWPPADARASVRYLSFYRRGAPCRNPFARFDE